ncbi:MAG: methicillin resistance protein [Nitrospira sp.]|jgi:hypothetical protein|nr:methicillin resistance protein [Nitrospira sp.]
MQISVVPYTHARRAEWDAFCHESNNATFLHTRRFLSYHGSRFEDASLFVIHEGQVVGVLPAARDPFDSTTISSHPGITYGGLVVSEWLTGDRSLVALERIAEYYKKSGFTRLTYKVVPYIYHRRPAQDDLYALYRIGARRYRTDLAAVIDLEDRGAISSRRLRAIKKARKNGISITKGSAFISNFWSVLTENLATQHNVCPVHSEQEMASLMESMPNDISLCVALDSDEIIAGVVLFDFLRVRHCQYIGVAEAGRRKAALDLVFDSCIQEADQLGLRFFSFGISTEHQGQMLNAGLHTFKTEFGAGGIVHEFYEFSLA